MTNRKVKKISEIASATVEASVSVQPRRLCSEIQLFDICELKRCRFRDDRFCTDPEMLSRFEALSEPEERPLNHCEDETDEMDYSDYYDDEDDLYDDEETEEELYNHYEDDD